MQEGGRHGGAAVRGFHELAEGSPTFHLLRPRSSLISTSLTPLCQPTPTPTPSKSHCLYSTFKTFPQLSTAHRPVQLVSIARLVSTCLLSWSPGPLRCPVLYSHPYHRDALIERLRARHVPAPMASIPLRVPGRGPTTGSSLPVGPFLGPSSPSGLTAPLPLLCSCCTGLLEALDHTKQTHQWPWSHYYLSLESSSPT